MVAACMGRMRATMHACVPRERVRLPRASPHWAWPVVCNASVAVRKKSKVPPNSGPSAAQQCRGIPWEAKMALTIVCPCSLTFKALLRGHDACLMVAKVVGQRTLSPPWHRVGALSPNANLTFCRHCPTSAGETTGAGATRTRGKSVSAAGAR